MKPYPVEGMEKGIKIGGVVGFAVGVGLWFHWWGVSLHRTGFVMACVFSGIGSFLGFLLGALSDKICGKWRSECLPSQTNGPGDIPPEPVLH